MPRLKLTERAIRALPAPHPSGQQLYWDTGDGSVKGLGVQCSGTTEIKSFVVKGNMNGRSHRNTIGRVGEMKLEEARAKARDMRASFRSGVNPRAAQASGMTLRQAMDARLAARAASLKPRTIDSYRKEITRHLGDWLDIAVKDITTEMCAVKHKSIAAKIAAEGKYDGHATANRVMTSFGVMYNYTAKRNGGMPQNPVTLVREDQWYDIEPRDGELKISKYAAFYKAIMELQSAVARDYLILITFTGLRRREAASLEWGQVDLAEKTLVIPPQKTKNGKKLTLPLTDVVFNMLSARQAMGMTRYVFPAVGRAGYIQEPKFHLQQIAKKTGIKVTIHDLRRSYARVVESCDPSVITLAALLNHKLPGATTTQNYARPPMERMREVAEKTCAKLKALCQFTPPQNMI
jgi:integrase